MPLAALGQMLPPLKRRRANDSIRSSIKPDHIVCLKTARSSNARAT
jgi:hypothetical protein